MDKILLKKIIDELKNKEQSLEDLIVEIEGIRYGVTEYKCDVWIDEGKYQYTSETGRLCAYDEGWNISVEFDYYLEQSISRSGSYYSYWEYTYDNMSVYTIEEIVIPEKIIPEHKVNKRVPVNWME